MSAVEVRPRSEQLPGQAKHRLEMCKMEEMEQSLHDTEVLTCKPHQPQTQVEFWGCLAGPMSGFAAAASPGLVS